MDSFVIPFEREMLKDDFVKKKKKNLILLTNFPVGSADCY